MGEVANNGSGGGSGRGSGLEVVDWGVVRARRIGQDALDNIAPTKDGAKGGVAGTLLGSSFEF